MVVVFLIVSLTSCVKDTTNTTYAGPDLVEFANPNYIAPLNPTAKTVATTTTPKNDSMYIQLVGPQRSTGTNVTFAVDAASTAVAGTDYSLTTPSPVEIAGINKFRYSIKFFIQLAHEPSRTYIRSPYNKFLRPREAPVLRSTCKIQGCE